MIRPLFKEDYLESPNSEQQLGIWRAFLVQEAPSPFPDPEVGLGSAWAEEPPLSSPSINVLPEPAGNKSPVCFPLYTKPHQRLLCVADGDP